MWPAAYAPSYAPPRGPVLMSAAAAAAYQAGLDAAAVTDELLALCDVCATQEELLALGRGMLWITDAETRTEALAGKTLYLACGPLTVTATLCATARGWRVLRLFASFDGSGRRLEYAFSPWRSQAVAQDDGSPGVSEVQAYVLECFHTAIVSAASKSPAAFS